MTHSRVDVEIPTVPEVLLVLFLKKVNIHLCIRFGLNGILKNRFLMQLSDHALLLFEQLLLNFLRFNLPLIVLIEVVLELDRMESVELVLRDCLEEFHVWVFVDAVELVPPPFLIAYLSIL